MNIPIEALEKLKKLLRLSKSPNEHESALAMQRAQEIALRYAVDLASVSANDQKPSDRNIEQEKVSKKATRYRKMIIWILQNHFSVKIVYDGGSSARDIWYIGTKSDIEFAQWVYNFLDEEFPRLWKRYSVSTYVPDNERTTYFYGVYQGLNAKLDENKKKIVSERIAEIASENGVGAAQTTSNNYAIAVRDNKVAIDKAMKSFFPDLGKGVRSRITLRSNGTHSAGMSAGRSINLNRPISYSSGSAALRG